MLSIILIILYIIVVILIFKFVRSVIKAIIFSLAILFIAFIITSILFVNDLRDIKEHSEDPLLFLFEDEGEIITGISFVFNEEGEILLLSDNDTDNLNNYYKNKDFESLLGENYKIFFTNKKVFDNAKRISFGKGTERAMASFERETFLEILPSDNLLEIFVEKVEENRKDENKSFNRELIIRELGKEEEFRSKLFGLSLSGLMEVEGPIFILDQIKGGGMEVYPKTITFKLIEILPSKLSDILKQKIAFKKG